MTVSPPTFAVIIPFYQRSAEPLVRALRSIVQADVIQPYQKGLDLSGECAFLRMARRFYDGRHATDQLPDFLFGRISKERT